MEGVAVSLTTPAASRHRVVVAASCRYVGEVIPAFVYWHGNSRLIAWIVAWWYVNFVGGPMCAVSVETRTEKP